MFSFWTNLWELGWMINLQTEPFLNVFLVIFGDAAQAAACETLRAEMAAEQAFFVNPIPLTWWIGSVLNQGFQVYVLDRRTYETYWIIFNSHAHHMYRYIYISIRNHHQFFTFWFGNMKSWSCQLPGSPWTGARADRGRPRVQPIATREQSDMGKSGRKDSTVRKSMSF